MKQNKLINALRAKLMAKKGMEINLKKDKVNNKGFSLVELIIVIAIMVILVAVLAPQFTKYVERSRIGIDIQNASECATAIQVALAEGRDADLGNAGTIDDSVVSSVLTSMPSAPVSKSKTVGAGSNFTFNITDGAVEVSCNSKQLYPVQDADISTALAE